MYDTSTQTVELLRKEDRVSPQVVDGETFTVEGVIAIKADATTPALFHTVVLEFPDGEKRRYEDVHVVEPKGLYS